MDRGAWRATVHGVAKSQMKLKRLSTHAQWQDSPVTLLHKKNHAKKRIYYVVAFTHNSRTSKQEVNTDESSHGEVGVGRDRLACMCLLLVMVMICLAKIGFFRISRELQLNLQPWEQAMCIFLKGKASWERCRKQRVQRFSLAESLPGKKKKRGVFFLLGSAIVSGCESYPFWSLNLI